MSGVQFDLAILASIILINVFITFLYRKYYRLKQNEDKSLGFGNDSSTVSVIPGSFMPRVPFLILRKEKNQSLNKIIIAHNFLCLIVYGLFVLVIFYNFK